MRAKKHFVYGLTVFLVIIAGRCCWIAAFPSEPAFEGRTLSAWLRDYDSFGPGVTYDAVNGAISHIGTNALPTLLTMFRSKDSGLGLLAMKIAAKQRLFAWRPTPAETLHNRALSAFRVLGPSASVELPALRSLNNRYNYPYVMSAIAECGPDALLSLTNELRSELKEVRSYAAYELGTANFDASAAVPALVKGLLDDSVEVRCAAARSLGEIAKQPNAVIPALIRTLRTQSNQVKKAAAFALGQYGAQAGTALPTLTSALHDPDVDVRRQALSALSLIERGVKP